MEISQGVLVYREIVAMKLLFKRHKVGGHEMICNRNVRKKAGAGEYFEEKNGTIDKRKI